MLFVIILIIVLVLYVSSKWLDNVFLDSSKPNNKSEKKNSEKYREYNSLKSGKKKRRYIHSWKDIRKNRYWHL